MRIFNWMQNKINERQGTKKWTVGSSSNRYPIQEPCKEEFSDWPNGLLAIGTFGNKQLKEDLEKSDLSGQDSLDLPKESSDFLKEEVDKLQKELTKLLALKPIANSIELGYGEKANLPLDKFLNCPSSLEIDRTDHQKFCDDDLDGDDLLTNNSVILRKGKEVCLDNKKVIRQKSLSFLLKKVFVCQGGFAPTPSLRDSVPESRMEKLLREILQKKIYPQSSASSSTRKYITSKRTAKGKAEDQTQEKANEGCKWVKTDSEFIVLEI